MSSGLNSIAAVVIENLIHSYFGRIPDSRMMLISKLTAILFGFVLIGMGFLSSLMGNILQATLTIFGIIGGPLLGLYTLGMFLPWTNSKGALVGWLSSIAVTVWIGTGTILYKVHDSKLPVSIAMCADDNQFNLTSLTSSPVHYKVPVSIYRLSYLHLSSLAVLTVLVVGILISYITGFHNPNDLDPNLISPPIRRFYKWLTRKCKWTCVQRSLHVYSVEDPKYTDINGFQNDSTTIRNDMLQSPYSSSDDL